MEEFRTNYLPRYQLGLRANRADTEEGTVASVISDLVAKCESDHITYLDIQREVLSSFGITPNPQKIGYLVRGLGIKALQRVKVGNRWTMCFRADDPVLEKISQKYGQNVEEGPDK